MISIISSKPSVSRRHSRHSLAQREQNPCYASHNGLRICQTAFRSKATAITSLAAGRYRSA
jgi:hypothetical protein